MTPVWAVPDQPGGLAGLLGLLAENHIDVEYRYSLFAHTEGKAYMILRISNEPAFLSVLSVNRVRLVGMDELGLFAMRNLHFLRKCGTVAVAHPGGTAYEVSRM